MNSYSNDQEMFDHNENNSGEGEEIIEEDDEHMAEISEQDKPFATVE